MQTLKAGDMIDIVAPSSPPSPLRWKRGITVLKSWGLKPLWNKSHLRPWLFHAHNNRQREAFLKQAFLNKNSLAVWMLRGGSGLQKLIPSFASAYPLLSKKSKNKLFIGYSDATALHLYLNKKNQASLHAPHIEELADLSPVKQKELKNILFGTQKEIVFKNLHVFSSLNLEKISAKPLGKIFNKKDAEGGSVGHALIPQQRLQNLQPATDSMSLLLPPHNKKHKLNSSLLNTSQKITLKGRVVGGNLSLLSSHIGTPYMSSSFRSRFLFVEDINEEDYQIDRLLHHAFYSGILKGVQAVLLGSFEPLKPTKIKKILKSFSAVFKGPLIFGLPCGHGPINRPLPLNSSAQLTIQNQKATLKISIK